MPRYITEEFIRLYPELVDAFVVDLESRLITASEMALEEVIGICQDSLDECVAIWYLMHEEVVTNHDYELVRQVRQRFDNMVFFSLLEYLFFVN